VRSVTLAYLALRKHQRRSEKLLAQSELELTEAEENYTQALSRHGSAYYEEDICPGMHICPECKNPCAVYAMSIPHKFIYTSYVCSCYKCKKTYKPWEINFNLKESPRRFWFRMAVTDMAEDRNIDILAGKLYDSLFSGENSCQKCRRI
jgi:hypothetical protein